jgi:hypothetical protein
VFRRQFYVQLLKILADRLRSPGRRGRIFVSMIGSIGDLVYLFPSLEVLRRRHVIDMGTGGYPYLAVVGNNPHVAQFYGPFIYSRSSRRGFTSSSATATRWTCDRLSQCRAAGRGARPVARR